MNSTRIIQDYKKNQRPNSPDSDKVYLSPKTVIDCQKIYQEKGKQVLIRLFDQI